MMYPFLTLEDQTEIVHSETLEDGRVKVYIEKPDAEDCFHSATCYLPEYDWQEISGLSPRVPRTKTLRRFGSPGRENACCATIIPIFPSVF